MSKIKVNYSSPLCYYNIANFLKDYITNDTIIVCIGTDKCIGDALGPLVGTLLEESLFPLPILGTLASPIHALNLDTRLKEISNNYPTASIIAIDACLGDANAIGEIHTRDEPIHPGKGVGKTLQSVGNASIIGIVDSSDSLELFTNRPIRLNLIMEMAKVIRNGIIHAYHLKNSL